LTKALPTQVHVISHTHWDREWYLTREEYRLRLVDLVDGVLDRMDRDEAFTFFHLDGQTIVLEDYLEVRPDQRERLRRRIGSGRLLVGPWYVMPDMFLVSGESLVRNLAIGHRIAESFGGVMRAGYTPDPFGHVAQMPQILAGFGLDNAILWRGFGGPQAEYIWEGHDGTRALLLHLPREGYCNGFRLPLFPKDRRVSESIAVVERERARSSVGSVLLMAGIDHTEPHPELLTLVGEIGRQSGVTAALSTLPTYVDAVRTAVAAREVALPTARGELRAGEDYSNLLPGVLSARTYLKGSNVRAQALLEKTLEPIALFAWLAGEAHPSGVLQYCWKTLIENHPHDSICGCSIDEVHDENDTRFARVLQAGESQLAKSLRALAKRVEPAPGGAIRFLGINTVVQSWSGALYVALDIPVESGEAGRMLDSEIFDRPLRFFKRGSRVAEVVDADGRAIPFQEVRREARVEQWTSRFEVPLAVHVERVHLVCQADLPAAGFASFDARIVAGEVQEAKSRADVRHIENEVLRIDANGDGTIQVFDKRSGTTYARVLEFEDTGDVGDEYNYSPPAVDRRLTNAMIARQIRVTGTASDVLRSSLTIEAILDLPEGATADRRGRADRATPVSVVVNLEISRGSAVIDGRVRITNTAKDHRLRVLFPTAAAAVAESRADSAFAVVTRPAQRFVPSTPMPEAPVNSAPLQSFVDAGDDRAGVIVLSEGLMEFEVLAPGHGRSDVCVALTVVRAVGWLSREDLGTRKGNAGPSLETPGAQCLGTYEFRFAFIPRSTPPGEAALCALGRNFLAPPRTVAGTGNDAAAGSLPRRHSFLRADIVGDDRVALSALKMADDREAVVVRVFNPATKSVELTLHSPAGTAQATRTNLREQSQDVMKLDADAVRLAVGPRKIATIAFER
jgi:mannosylglycerate hydrolase